MCDESCSSYRRCRKYRGGIEPEGGCSFRYPVGLRPSKRSRHAYWRLLRDTGYWMRRSQRTTSR